MASIRKLENRMNTPGRMPFQDTFTTNSSGGSIAEARFHRYDGCSTRVLELPRRYAPVLRLNSICPYYTMFPLIFPFSKLKSAEPDDWVLDPFCGRGTTNYAARLVGLPSVGIDSNIVAAAIAAAKFVEVKSYEIVDLCRSIISDVQEPQNMPYGQFWEMCYDHRTLRDICKIREYLLTHCTSAPEIALRALMLGILHGPKRKLAAYLSNQMPRTYATKPAAAIKFWEKRNMKPPRVDVLTTVTHRAQFCFSRVPSSVPGGAFMADSRTIDFRSMGGPFSWVITSPPYYGMRTYWPDQWLRNWFLGGPSTVQYTQEGQLSHKGENKFILELAQVWARAAQACVPGARLLVRFGALPSLPSDPITILEQSLITADCGWRVIRVDNAGRASKGRRQAEQFRCDLGKPSEEIDLYAVLEE